MLPKAKYIFFFLSGFFVAFAAAAAAVALCGKFGASSQRNNCKNVAAQNAWPPSTCHAHCVTAASVSNAAATQGVRTLFYIPFIQHFIGVDLGYIDFVQKM